jgi:hypothetical protein
LIAERYFGFNAHASRSTMTMLRRWVPAGLLLSSVATITPSILAQTAPTKTAAPATTAKPPAPATSAKPLASTSAPAAKPPTDPKAAAATPPPDAKAPAPAPDPKAGTAATASPDPEKESARLIEDGRKAYKAGQFDKARELFAAAYKLKAESNTQLLLAMAEAKSNRPRDAAEHLEAYLREAKTASADDKQTAQKLYDEVTAKLGTWWVKVNIDGADIFLDGKPVGRSPLVAPLFVEPNSHEIEVKKEGYLPEKELAAIAPNTESETNFVMKPAPAVVTPKEPDKKIEKPIVEPPSPPSPAWRTYGIIGGGALTALGLGLGIGLSVSASGKGDEAAAQLAKIERATPNTYGICGGNIFQPNQADCAKLQETLASQDARANGAVFGFVLAGIGAVGTAGLILLPKTPFGRKLMGNMKFSPIIGFDRLGGTLTGSF